MRLNSSLSKKLSLLPIMDKNELFKLGIRAEIRVYTYQTQYSFEIVGYKDKPKSIDACFFPSFEGIVKQ